MAPNRLLALWFILFSEKRYAPIGGPEALQHMKEFRADALSALGWVTGASVLAISILWLRAGIAMFFPETVGKWLAFAGIFTGGIATWFALANPEDTWDVEDRLDTALRGLFFKVAFFPGLVASIVGTFW